MKTVIIKQLNTEKTYKLVEKNVYTFLVSVNANKCDVKKEVEKIFGVKVDSVNITSRPRKTKSFRGVAGEIGGGKKACVKVANGMKIDFENVVKG